VRAVDREIEKPRALGHFGARGRPRSQPANARTSISRQPARLWAVDGGLNSGGRAPPHEKPPGVEAIFAGR
jgi:hypothetical protein